MTAKRVLVSGRVQGVFFRAFTRDKALEVGASGWVRNLPDGRVEAHVEGTDAQVEAMLAWFPKGSPYSKVAGVEVEDAEAEGLRETFVIRR